MLAGMRGKKRWCDIVCIFWRRVGEMTGLFVERKNGVARLSGQFSKSTFSCPFERTLSKHSDPDTREEQQDACMPAVVLQFCAELSVRILHTVLSQC